VGPSRGGLSPPPRSDSLRMKGVHVRSVVSVRTIRSPGRLTGKAARTSENPVKAKFTGELTYPIAPALMLQVAGRDVGHSLRIANISLQQEGIHHPAYLSIGVTSYSGWGYAECLEGCFHGVLGCGYAGSCM
jgi:hypothetical protein